MIVNKRIVEGIVMMLGGIYFRSYLDCQESGLLAAAFLVMAFILFWGGFFMVRSGLDE